MSKKSYTGYCSFCGIKTNNKIYCSRACYAIGRTAKVLKSKSLIHFNTGRKHSAQARLNMSLAHIGKPVSEETRRKRSVSMIGKNLGKTHSEKTRAHLSKKAKESYAKGQKVVTGHPGFFASDLGFRVKSGWEANIARMLIFLGIEFKYEPQFFKLSSGENYLPDFYFPKYEAYLEVKGDYLGNHSIEKPLLFRQDYKKTVLILNKSVYLKLQKIWKIIVPNWDNRQ